MKRNLKFVLFIGLILAGLYIFAQLKLKNVLTRELSRNLKCQVYIGKVGLGLPLHAYVKNLVIFEPLQEGKALSEFVRINEIRISPALLPFLKGKLLLRSIYIIRPEANIVRLDKTRFNFSDLLSIKGETAKTEKEKKELPLLILKLRIKDGLINFTDKTVGEVPVKLSLQSFNFSVAKIAFPLTDVATRYDLKAKIRENDLKELSDINSSGWLNITKKNMEAEFSLNGLGLAYLSPYFRKAIAGSIDGGRLNFRSDIVSLDNDLSAKCRLEIEGLKITSSSAMILGVSVDALLASLKDAKGKLELDFELRTKFDQPRLDLSRLISGVLNRTLEKAVLNVPQSILKAGEKTTEGGIEDVGKELKNIGEGLKKILGK